MSTEISLKRVLDNDAVAMELVFTALVAYPDLESASMFMREQGYEISTAKLAVYRDGQTPKSEEFRERRKELAPQLEAALADNLLSEATVSTRVIGVALETTMRLLNEGRIADPSRVARDLSQIRTQGIDKRLALQGRPTQITANRSLEEIARALEGMGVAQRVALDVPDAEVIEDEDQA
jgi:hypothetical protein